MMSTTTTTDECRSEQQAYAQLESISEMVERLRHAQECNGDDCKLERDTILSVFGYVSSKISKKEMAKLREEYHDGDSAERMILEDALSVEIGGWWIPGAEPGDGASNYRILLCTGGPAARIYGSLGRFNEPDTAVLEHQDWFTPWERLYISDEETEILLDYARCFYFGE